MHRIKTLSVCDKVNGAMYNCPECGSKILFENNNEYLPVICPECGADLYPEEIIFQQMMNEDEKTAV